MRDRRLDVPHIDARRIVARVVQEHPALPPLVLDRHLTEPGEERRYETTFRVGEL